VLAVILVVLLLKPFSNITGETIVAGIAFTPTLWVALLALTIMIGLLAGSYPAFYLTSFNPVSVLTGKNLSRSGKGALFVRNGLVVFQFTISTILIIGTLVVFKQLNFFRNANMGLDKENVVVIANSHRLGTGEESSGKPSASCRVLAMSALQAVSLQETFLATAIHLIKMENNRLPGISTCHLLLLIMILFRHLRYRY